MPWMVVPSGPAPQSPSVPRAVLAVACLAAAAAAAGCGDHERPAPSQPPPEAQAQAPQLETTHFAADLDVDLDGMTRLEDGIYIRDARAGRGATAEPGRTVVVQYRAWLPDGRLFEQRPSPEGFGASEFVLGQNAPVEGLNIALAGMRTGGVRLVVLAAERGYGLVGRPAGVPPGSPLVFEVALLRVSDPTP